MLQRQFSQKPISLPNTSLSIFSFHNHDLFFNLFAHLCFGHVGALVLLGLDLQSHSPPLVMPSKLHPAALKLAPVSSSSMYVMIRAYPNPSEILAALEYKNEQTLLVPSVQSRVTSTVSPSSHILLTGLPTCTTPTSFPSTDAPTLYLSPCVAA